MKVDAELALDDLGQAWRGPQVGGEAEGFGILAQPAKNLSLLCSPEFAGSARMRLGIQAIGAAFLITLPPFAYGAHVDIEKVGNFLLCVAVEKSIDGQASPSFEFRS